MHKFKIQQLVRLTHPSSAMGRANASGVYEITRLMPADPSGEFSYRVREHGGGAGERAVRESEITARTTPNT